MVCCCGDDNLQASSTEVSSEDNHLLRNHCLNNSCYRHWGSRRGGRLEKSCRREEGGVNGEEREKVEGDGEGSMSGRRGWMEKKGEITWKGEGGRSAQIGVRRVVGRSV